MIVHHRRTTPSIVELEYEGVGRIEPSQKTEMKSGDGVEANREDIRITSSESSDSRMHSIDLRYSVRSSDGD